MIGPNRKRKKMKAANARLFCLCHKCNGKARVLDKETGRYVSCRGCRGTGTLF